MSNFINCVVHMASDGNLLTGENYTAMIDCGGAFCADIAIERVKSTLGGRPLDYIILSHTHYDHVGALPFFRMEWPQLQVVTSEKGAAVLQKDTPRRVIRELSLVAAKHHGATFDEGYSDEAFRADITVKSGDIVVLGGLSVHVIETPGHTRDSLSFHIPELEILALSETLGILMPDGDVHPAYLTSFVDTINAIETCSKIPYKHLSMPHQGIISSEKAVGFFDKALAATIACRDFILEMAAKNLDRTQMLEAYFKKYCNDDVLSCQPKEAFLANTNATITCTLNEAM